MHASTHSLTHLTRAQAHDRLAVDHPRQCPFCKHKVHNDDERFGHYWNVHSFSRASVEEAIGASGDGDADGSEEGDDDDDAASCCSSSGSGSGDGDKAKGNGSQAVLECDGSDDDHDNDDDDDDDYDVRFRKLAKQAPPSQRQLALKVSLRLVDVQATSSRRSTETFGRCRVDATGS